MHTQKTDSIKQGCLLPATAHDIYELWMDSGQHTQLTGSEAKIGRKVGEPFATFGGWATGKNIELISDRKIVQTWRASDWPDDATSVLTVRLMPAAKGTKLLFTQTGVPKQFAKSIAEGWIAYYWEPMKKYLTGNS